MTPAGKILVLLIFLLGSKFSFAQTDSSSQKIITVHFLYGSKPAHGCKSTEKKLFGGIHGGHVSMQFDSVVFSFTPKYGWHIISRHRHIEGGYILERLDTFCIDSAGDKYTSIRIPLTDSQYAHLLVIEKKFLAESPYDYAFFGMRCASAAADVLSQLGILKERSDFGDIRKNFYPKRLRRKLLRYARKNKLEVIRHDGRKSRKWERD
jgi:hypothetical protein